jgi:hypothetical protein
VTDKRVVFQWRQRSCGCELGSSEDSVLLSEIVATGLDTKGSPRWLQFGIFFSVLGGILLINAYSTDPVDKDLERSAFSVGGLGLLLLLIYAIKLMLRKTSLVVITKHAGTFWAVMPTDIAFETNLSVLQAIRVREYNRGVTLHRAAQEVQGTSSGANGGSGGGPVGYGGGTGQGNAAIGMFPPLPQSMVVASSVPRVPSGGGSRSNGGGNSDVADKNSKDAGGDLPSLPAKGGASGSGGANGSKNKDATASAVDGVPPLLKP